MSKLILHHFSTFTSTCEIFANFDANGLKDEVSLCGLEPNGNLHQLFMASKGVAEVHTWGVYFDVVVSTLLSNSETFDHCIERRKVA
jgi:hypothetical protein